MPKVYIDGKEYDAKPGRNMLQVAIDNGLDLPYFCWHPAMGSVGSCRLCAVRAYKDESDTKGKIMMACMTPAADGTRISINDPDAVEFRRYVIEWLMVNHPHDCPVCDEGGECHLQDMTAMCGHVYRRYRGRKRTYNNQYLGPFVNHEMNRCIQCYRCVRFYKDTAGGTDFDVFASKNRVYFGRQQDGVLQSEFSGNLVEVCPTGVFTDKTYDHHYTRKWDLETAPSVCIHCGLGCNTIPGSRYQMLRRVTARFNGDVNGYFLCDRGRYGYEFVNSEKRIRGPRIQGASHISETKTIEHAVEMLRDANGVIGIGSPRAPLEANFALKKLVGDENFSDGLSGFEHENTHLALNILQNGPARTPSLGEVENADVVLVLGADPTNESPMLDFAIRQAMRKAPLDVARKLKIPDWDANAVAYALQNAKGKLYTAAPWPIKIEEIAAGAVHMNPDQIAAFGKWICENIGSNQTEENGVASQISADLRDARQPLIITSISAGENVIKAATNIAWSLCNMGKNCWLSIAVPEANTMGVGLMGGFSAQEAVERVNSGRADTLVVLQNDLARRVSPSQFEILKSKVKNLIVLDCIETATTADADALFAVQSYVESDGTFVNNEGRAQRFFQVFVPEGEMHQAWWVLQELAERTEWSIYEDVLHSLAAQMPVFAPAVDAAPSAAWRNAAGQKVARMPHRYSGRTAMNANVNVKESKTPDDPATALAFSMEGDQNPVPSPLIPRFWYPGWNSENSINKFQIEVGGPLHGGNPGKRLIESSGNDNKLFDLPEAGELEKGQVWVVPRPRIFGSEELSILAPGIAQMVPQAQFTINPELAKTFKVTENRIMELEIGGQVRALPAHLDEAVPEDVLSVPANSAETIGVLAPTVSRIGR